MVENLHFDIKVKGVQEFLTVQVAIEMYFVSPFYALPTSITALFPIRVR